MTIEKIRETWFPTDSEAVSAARAQIEKAKKILEKMDAIYNKMIELR